MRQNYFSSLLISLAIEVQGAVETDGPQSTVRVDLENGREYYPKVEEKKSY